MIPDEQPYAPAHRLFEAGALIQRHMGPGAVHEAIEAAVEYSDVTEGDEDDLEAAFLIGFGEGASRLAFDRGPVSTEGLVTPLEARRLGGKYERVEGTELLRPVNGYRPRFDFEHGREAVKAYRAKVAAFDGRVA